MPESHTGMVVKWSSQWPTIPPCQVSTPTTPTASDFGDLAQATNSTFRNSTTACTRNQSWSASELSTLQVFFTPTTAPRRVRFCGSSSSTFSVVLPYKTSLRGSSKTTLNGLNSLSLTRSSLTTLTQLSQPLSY